MRLIQLCALVLRFFAVFLVWRALLTLRDLYYLIEIRSIPLNQQFSDSDVVAQQYLIDHYKIPSTGLGCTLGFELVLLLAIAVVLWRCTPAVAEKFVKDIDNL